MRRINIWLGAFALIVGMTFVACTDTDEYYFPNNLPAPGPVYEHTPAARQLIQICESNAEVKALLSHAIAQAAAINPDRRYNPAQTLEEFYDYIDWNVTQLPWNVSAQAPGEYGSSLYGRTDQGIGYFWFIVDQPLDELRDRGYFYPTVEFVEPFSSWLSTYCSTWGDWLNTEASWNDYYYDLVKDDPDWGLDKGWYGEGNQWKTYNEFFARELASPDMRPISDAELVAPVDSWPKKTWAIDDDNQLVYTAEEQLQIKTARLSDIAQLIGNDSQYKDAFAGGTLTHTFLDVNCYHRYHAPVDGVLRELRKVPGVCAGGGYTLWDNETKLYYYVNDIGFQMVETRACAIIETPDYGLMAMIPVGMSQICSVNWLPELHVGQQLQRGDEMGFFQFGGSDIVMIFQRGVDVQLLHDGDLLLMGEPYAHLVKDN